MDPYLEHPTIFPDLHDSLVSYLREFVQGSLPDPYFAAIGDRVWVEISEREIGPDIDVLRRQNGPGFETSRGGRTALAAELRAEPVIVTVPHDERREPFLEIYSRRDGERLVTTIEILSLSNKTPGAHGRDLYLRKQKEVLASQVHLVEIDLLRAGEHSSAVPLRWALPKTGRFDYHVSIHHFDNLEDYFVYPILLRQKLPQIAIPLLPGDAPVTADLQAVFDRAYETGPYRRRVRYAETEPEPPLPPADRDWARALAAAGRQAR
jgi:hypothetical protein